MKIHSTAIVEDGAKLGADVEVGPYAHIGKDVVIGDGTVVKQGVIIDGHSFSAVPLPYEEDDLRPDFCIGTDPFHTPKKLLHTCVTFLRGCGFEVAVNRPFSGTIVPVEHLHSDINVDSIMIEINRHLYVDSNGNKTDMFPVIQRILAALTDEIERGCV